MKKFAIYYLILSFIFMSLYIFLYFKGAISYFGISTNIFLSFPYFVQSKIIALFIFTLVLFSGKRAILLTILLQFVVYLFSKKSFLFKILFLAFFIVLVLFLLNYTSLLDRIKLIFAVDFNDKYTLYRAFSGRFEEILGIYNFFLDNEFKFLFGASPGEYYNWIIESYGSNNAYYEIKNYAHFMPFSFLFRYGIIVTLFIYFFIFFTLIKYYKKVKELYLVFVGILFSSCFGANLLTDPFSWILIAFFFKYKNNN
ncbi:hypothetical protein CRU99_11155 [Malaciobacter mytili]|nr:hypothetical protein CRU99_11155 [Malaciobacter mytili]